MTEARIVMDLGDIQGRLSDIDDVAAAEMRSAVVDATDMVQTTARREVVKDLRVLERGIITEIRPGPPLLGIVGVLHGPAREYAPTVEYGRRAGRRPPPTRAIRPWLRRHGIPEDAAFVVARAIGRRGLRPRPFLFPSARRHRQDIMARAAEARRRILDRLRGR